MAEIVIYVTVRDGRWAVMREGAERATKVYDTQAEAIAHAKKIVDDSGGGRVMVQNREGKFRKA